LTVYRDIAHVNVAIPRFIDPGISVNVRLLTDCNFADLGGYKSPVQATSSTISLVRCSFTDNSILDDDDYGIIGAWYDDAAVRLQGCDFRGNNATNSLYSWLGASYFSDSPGQRVYRFEVKTELPVKSLQEVDGSGDSFLSQKSDTWFLNTQAVRIYMHVSYDVDFLLRVL
jgi:hypothetical protein